MGFLVFAIVVTFLLARKFSLPVHVERSLDAPLAQVWHLWTDPEIMKNWWGPKDFTAPVIKSDFRVGGAFHYGMRSSKGEMFWNTGKYLEIVPQQRIVQSLSFADETGKVVAGKDTPVPGDWPDEVNVLVTFEERDGRTFVAVTETGIPALMKLFAQMGWAQQFDKIEALLKAS